jgi:hypothetical protein
VRREGISVQKETGIITSSSGTRSYPNISPDLGNYFMRFHMTVTDDLARMHLLEPERINLPIHDNIGCSTEVWHLETYCLNPIITKTHVLDYPRLSRSVSIPRSSIPIDWRKTSVQIHFSRDPTKPSKADNNRSPVPKNSSRTSHFI